jgi:hypothetical protein
LDSLDFGFVGGIREIREDVCAAEPYFQWSDMAASFGARGRVSTEAPTLQLMYRTLVKKL